MDCAHVALLTGDRLPRFAYKGVIRARWHAAARGSAVDVHKEATRRRGIETELTVGVGGCTQLILHAIHGNGRAL